MPLTWGKALVRASAPPTGCPVSASRPYLSEQSTCRAFTYTLECKSTTAVLNYPKTLDEAIAGSNEHFLYLHCFMCAVKAHSAVVAPATDGRWLFKGLDAPFGLYISCKDSFQCVVVGTWQVNRNCTAVGT